METPLPQKNRMKGLTTGFIAFMCMLLFVSLSTIYLIQTTLFSAAFLEKSAEKSNYYENLTQQITRQVQDFGLGSGIPEKILEKSVSEDQVRRDFNNYSNQAFRGTNLPLDGEQFQADLRQPILAYAKKQKQELTPEVKQGIDHFTATSFKAYEKYIKLHFLPAFGQRIQLFSNQLTLIKVVLFCALVLLVIGLIYLVHAWWHRLFRYSAYIFGGAGLMFLIVPGYLHFSKIIEHIAISSKPLYLLLTTYLSGFLMRFLYVGGTCLVLALLCAIISEQLRRKV